MAYTMLSFQAPGRFRRGVQILSALGLLAFGAFTSATGCSSTPKFCDGGYVRTVGDKQTCEGLCSPSKCANPGNVCVDNYCALECQSHADCNLGESCLAATPDGTSTPTKTCQNNGRAAIGAHCPNGANDCSMNQAPACPDGSNCDYNQCGGDTCAPDPAACGGKTMGCSIGKCPDNTRCTVPGCTQDQCKPMVCLTSGAGDEASYCTILDCHSDADCGGGYFCTKVRDPHKICGAPAQKIPALCGTTTDTGCVMANASDGTTYTQGPWCSYRNECRIRRLCDPCQKDDDCGALKGMHCTAMGADKFCTTDCAGDSDCGNGFQCTMGACVPRAGSCTGKKTFCEPCHNDDECGAGMYCGRESSGVDRVCFLPAGGTPCTSDAQCPVSPSGYHGKCFDESTNNSPGDGYYHTCYLPFFETTDKFQCWGGNPGTPCAVDTDCQSKMCMGATDVKMGTCQ